MDVSKFTEEKTGKLVPVNVPEKDQAFTPDPLPPKWQFPASLRTFFSPDIFEIAYGE
jgi:hypothetical protein